MYILGLHGGLTREDQDGGPGFGQHDGAAVLIAGREIVAAIEEERLNRVKHSNFFPFRAIRFCLEQAGIGLEDVDRVVFNLSEPVMDGYLAARAMRHPTEPVTGARALLTALMAREHGVDVAGRLRFCHHHLAHAASALYASGFERSLVVTLDGDGDGLSGMVLVARDGRMEPIHRFPESKSLGGWYTHLSKILGYTRFDEYKVMGLAPLGDPRVYAELFTSFYRLLPGGDYEIRPMAEHLHHLGRAGLLAGARRKGEAFTQVHRDFAAALQAALEEIGLHVVRHFREVTGEDHLCLAGGVAHNCSLNGKILYSGLFRRVFVQPAAHDAGTALGAAWLVLQEEGLAPPNEPMRHVYLGSHLPPTDEIGLALAPWQDLVICQRLDRVAEQTAELLADGAVVGWIQGRSEFGPRALGNRSILADPRPPANKDLINRMVKKREGYRPFAPSVVAERAGEFFRLPPEQAEFPFMIFVLEVQPEWRQRLGAITHADGTARVHTVGRRDNPLYWELLMEFGKRTGVPVLLNTSFNNNAEPIVDSVEDAVVCYLTTGLQYLVVGDWLVRKRELEPCDPAWTTLAPSLRPHRKLVRRLAGLDQALEARCFIESTASDFFCESTVPVEPDVFHLLLAADGRCSTAQLMDGQGIADEIRRQEITAALVDLFARRIVVLRPPAADPGPAPF
jgi:carbamoyltransferase